MLVIRRRQGESIVLAENIEVTILEISASRVKLGITAPAGVLVQRKEVILAGERNVAAAASPVPPHLSAWAKGLRAPGEPGA